MNDTETYLLQQAYGFMFMFMYKYITFDVCIFKLKFTNDWYAHVIVFVDIVHTACMVRCMLFRPCARTIGSATVTVDHMNQIIHTVCILFICAVSSYTNTVRAKRQALGDIDIDPVECQYVQWN